MYKCIKAVFPVLTFDKSYQVGQEISETEYQNLEIKLRENFEATEGIVDDLVEEPTSEPVNTSEGLEGIQQPNTVTGNPDAPEPIILHLNGEEKES
jgi:hypothetical protein